MGTEKCASHDCCAINVNSSVDSRIKKILYIVFFINLGMFGIELVAGLIAQSNALLADSLDMLGDAIVYGISLFVLSKHLPLPELLRTRYRASLIEISKYIRRESVEHFLP